MLIRGRLTTVASSAAAVGCYVALACAAGRVSSLLYVCGGCSVLLRVFLRDVSCCCDLVCCRMIVDMGESNFAKSLYVETPTASSGLLQSRWWGDVQMMKWTGAHEGKVYQLVEWLLDQRRQYVNRNQ